MAQKNDTDIIYGVMAFAERRFVMYWNNNMGNRYQTMRNTGNYIPNGNHYTSGNTNTHKTNDTQNGYGYCNGCMHCCPRCHNCPCCGCCIVVVVNTADTKDGMKPQEQTEKKSNTDVSTDCEPL